MRVVVDLDRCRASAQCRYAAPERFVLRGDGSVYDPVPPVSDRAALDRAVQGAAAAPGWARAPARRHLMGAHPVLLFAAGNRDPVRFPDPDRFDTDREDDQHVGFGGALHGCAGAPPARIGAALTGLAARSSAPRLAEDPPPTGPALPCAACGACCCTSTEIG